MSMADAEAACFPGFPKLPGELRWMIWQMAVDKDATPRLYYYSLFHHDDEGRPQSRLQHMMRQYKANPESWMRHGWYRHGWYAPGRGDSTGHWCTPFPMRSRPRQCGWTSANRFSYYWDAGLLSACRESRAARLGYPNRLECLEADTGTAIRPRDRNTETAIPLDTNPKTTVRRPPNRIVAHHNQGDKVYLDIHSKHDIICLRFSPDDLAARVSELQWPVLLCRLPFFHLPYATDINLAFEFDESWDANLPARRDAVERVMMWDASHRGVVMRAHWAWMKSEIPRWARLWLIDRGWRLPADYKIFRDEDTPEYTRDLRCHWDTTYRDAFPCAPPAEHQIFSDGPSRYVESYYWDGTVHPRRVAQWERLSDYKDMPVLSFIWKMRRLCAPPKDGDCRNRPSDSEYFFRVLRQLPGADANGPQK